jgi:hypothetical protein
MKITQLIAAFQKFSEPREKITQTEPAPSNAVRSAPPASPAPVAGEGGDIVTISPEAVFLFAASQFDPRNITRNEVNELADTLHDGGAISLRDHAVISSPTDRQYFSSATGSNAAAPANLITEFQGKLAYDMAQSNILAVESDTRALAILGRLSSLRDELL